MVLLFVAAAVLTLVIWIGSGLVTAIGEFRETGDHLWQFHGFMRDRPPGAPPMQRAEVEPWLAGFTAQSVTGADVPPVYQWERSVRQDPAAIVKYSKSWHDVYVFYDAEDRVLLVIEPD